MAVRKWIVTMTIVMTGLVASIQPVQAQDPITIIIKEGVKKVIKAVDLQIQRLQNKTIWLQNAQKVAENAMSQAKLNEISEWVEKQRLLYRDYYQELWKVKNTVAMYHRIKDITDKQMALVREYKRAYTSFKADANFSAGELEYMGKFYTAVIDKSVKNIDQLFLVINSFSTQMSDAKRIEIINLVGRQADEHYNDLKQFNNQNRMLSFQRSKTKHDAKDVRQWYGLQ